MKIFGSNNGNYQYDFLLKNQKFNKFIVKNKQFIKLLKSWNLLQIFDLNCYIVIPFFVKNWKFSSISHYW